MDEEKIIKSAELLLDGLGLDLNNEHFKKTPVRWANMWMYELCNSLNCAKSPAEVLNVEFVEDKYNAMVVAANIEFGSICPHHLLPWIGSAVVAYIPKGKITGLSKLARLVDACTNRPVVQESVTEEIAEVLFKKLKPEGCGVMLRAKHLCVCGRGVRKQNMEMITTSLKGCFLDNDGIKQEFLETCRQK